MAAVRIIPQSLLARIFALYSATLLLFVGTGLGVFFSYELESETQDAFESATMLAELAAQTITESAVIGDYDTIKRTLDKSILRSQFDAAIFIDMKGTVLRSSNTVAVARQPPAWLRDQVAGQLSDVNRSISVGGVDYGLLRLSFAADRIAVSVWEFTKAALGIALASVLGGLGLIWFPLRGWLGKLDRARQLEQSMNNDGHAADSVRIDDLPLEFRGPFEVLQRTTNSLRSELEARKLAVASLRAAVIGMRPNQADESDDGDDIAALSETLSELVAAREVGRRQANEHNAQLNAVFALSPDGFILFDGQQNIRFVNTAFLRMTSTIAEEWLGLGAAAFSARISRLCVASSKFPGLDSLREAQLKHGPGGAWQAVGEEEGQRVICELTPPLKRILAFRLRLSTGEDVSQILYCRDVTQETEIDRMKSEFLSHAAHELRTPMASILGYSEVILAMDFPEEQRRELLQTIHRQSELLVSIINELLDLARIEARGEQEFVIEKLELHELIEHVVAGWAPPPERDPPAIVGDSGEIWLRGDKNKLMQAIGNVVSNAYKYSPAGGGVEIRLASGGKEGARHTMIAVTDQGIGMATEELSRVGERFYRADKSGKIPGTGLGLAIVKEIVEHHGGHTTFGSEPGKGTTVAIYLPDTDEDI
jgi:signal transduction histidine kinase